MQRVDFRCDIQRIAYIVTIKVTVLIYSENRTDLGALSSGEGADEESGGYLGDISTLAP